MQDHIKEVLFRPDGDIEELIQFYILKVTENKDDPNKIMNDFDLAKKGEEVPDSDDDEEEE